MNTICNLQKEFGDNMAITTVHEYNHFDSKRELLILLRTLTTPILVSELLEAIQNMQYSRPQKYNLITKLSYNLRMLQADRIIDLHNEHITIHTARFSLELQAYNL